MIVLPSNTIIGANQQSLNGPLIQSIPINIYNLQTQALYDLTQPGWAVGNITATVNGMGSTLGYDTIIWNTFLTATLITDGVLKLGSTSPNLTIQNLNNTNDAAGQWLNVFKSPPGEYIFQMILVGAPPAGVQQASFKDILYITS